MKRRTRLIAAAALAAVLVLVLSFYLHSWGGPILVLVAAAGLAWYRTQVARGEAAEQFFGDLGEETRLTGFQGGAPSEMPPLEPGNARKPPPGDAGH